MQASSHMIQCHCKYRHIGIDSQCRLLLDVMGRLGNNVFKSFYLTLTFLELLDKMLVSEIEKTKTRGLNVNDTKFKVIIELRESDELRDTVESNENSIEELERVVTKEHSSIITKLNQLKDPKNIKVLPFANAIYAELTPDQIHEISQYRDEVKKIRLSKMENVAC
jgi:Mg2+ and Co2+ transporter CorA